MFPRHLLTSPDSHADLCLAPKSKTISEQTIVLNHPFFIICFKQYLPVNQIEAVHTKNNATVRSIQKMFIVGNLQYPSNLCKLSIKSWRIVADQFIDILHYNILQDYKLVQQYLVDLISVNPEIPINLNIDVENRFYVCLWDFQLQNMLVHRKAGIPNRYLDGTTNVRS